MRPIVISQHNEDDLQDAVDRARRLFVVERETRWRIMMRKRLMRTMRRNNRMHANLRSGW